MAKVVRTENAEGHIWYHVSTRGGTKKFRRLSKTGLSDNRDNPEFWDFELNDSDINNLVGTTPKINDSYLWGQVYSILESGDFQSRLLLQKDSAIVPRTRLRRFRFAFRDWTKGLKRAQADFFSKNVECLKELWNLSVKEIETYKCQESFHPGNRVELPSGSKSPSKIQNTLEAASYFRNTYSAQKALGQITVQYLDREIAPLRTRNAKFVGGGSATSSGTGGMDLLLLSGKRVCAGEIKVGKDSELFEALLQVMWYASELATAAQIERVCKCYKKNDLEKTKIDMAVFSINQKDDPTRLATINLVNEINKNGGFKNLGCIHLLENQGDNWAQIKPNHH